MSRRVPEEETNQLESHASSFALESEHRFRNRAQNELSATQIRAHAKTRGRARAHGSGIASAERHYNLYTIPNTDFRILAGARTYHNIFDLESVSMSVYSGIEYHAKWFTLRPTIGAYFEGDIRLTYSVDALVNIRY